MGQAYGPTTAHSFFPCIPPPPPPVALSSLNRELFVEAGRLAGDALRSPALFLPSTPSEGQWIEDNEERGEWFSKKMCVLFLTSTLLSVKRFERQQQVSTQQHVSTENQFDIIISSRVESTSRANNGPSRFSPKMKARKP